MIGVILLAAGESARLGKPKQLLKYKESTLLEFVLNVATAVSEKVVLVLGANAEAIQKSLGKRNVTVVINEEWEEGMSSSICCGVSAIQRSQPAVEGVIILVCDQPYVSAELLQDLIAKHATTGKKIIASAYNNTIGVPALFDKTFFPGLMSLKGQEGAKKIIQQHPGEVATIAFPNGTIDIDTMEDYEKLRGKE
jgi:molybdenum cofactor cytidylyltransferase